MPFIHSGTHTFSASSEKAVDRALSSPAGDPNQWPGCAFFIAAICSGVALA
jgi:hypothetical protein